MHEEDPNQDAILDLAHVDAATEAEHHRNTVEQALRARGLEIEVPLPLSSPRRLGARARVLLQIGNDSRLLMHRPGSHEPMEPPLDAMARPEIASAARSIEQRLPSLPLLGRFFSKMELRSDGSRVVSVFEPHQQGRPIPPAAIEQLKELVPALGVSGALSIGTRRISGDPRVELELPVATSTDPSVPSSIPLRFGPLTFYQVNLEANQRLVAEIGAIIAAYESTAILDLYGGAGNLSLASARRGIRTTLMELHPPAAADARENVARHGLPVEVLQRDASTFKAGERYFDVAVLDPPRAGAGRVLAELCTTLPRAIILVSCHPISLARDLALARDAGYSAISLRLHDLFPLTSHVESVAVLERDCNLKVGPRPAQPRPHTPRRGSRSFRP